MRGIVGFEHGRGLRRRARPPASSGSSGAGRAGARVVGDGRGHGHQERGSTPTAKAKPHHSVGPQPSSGDQSIPPVGTTVMIVQKSAIGYVLAEANHQVVYTYSKDKKGGKPTCTGTCAADLAAGHRNAPGRARRRLPGPVRRGQGRERRQADHLQRPSALPLKGAKPLATTGNGQGGVWHVVQLSASDIR